MEGVDNSSLLAGEDGAGSRSFVRVRRVLAPRATVSGDALRYLGHGRAKGKIILCV